MSPARFALRGLFALLLLAALLVAGLVLALGQKPNLFQPVVERVGSYYLGRELQLGELLEVSLSEDTVLEVRGLQLANATWAGPDPMLSIDRARLVVSLPSLLGSGSIVVRRLEIEELSLQLLAPDGEIPNWNLPLRGSSSDQDEDEDEEAEDVLFPVVIEQAQLQNLAVIFNDPDQDINVSVTKAQLTRDETTGLSEVSLAGSVNQMPFSGEGVMGPTTALQTGRNLELDLSLSLAQLRLKAAGSIDDALALAGADLTLDVQAPRSRFFLDLIGLEEVRDGPLDFKGSLADGGPGLRVEAEGELAGFGLGAHGLIENPVELDGIDLDIYLNGPSMGEAGAVLGVVGFKDVPFDLAGSLYRRGTVLKIENGRLRAGQGQLSLSGVLPHFPAIDDWQADIVGRRLDLTVLGLLAGVEGLPQLYCDVDGQLSSDDQGVELVELRVTDGDVDLVINGVVGEMPDYLNTALHVRFSGNDLTRLQSLIGFETLPAAPYELAGELSRDAGGWRIENGRLSSQGFRVEVSAELDRLADFQRLDSQINLSSPDVFAALHQYGVDIETTGAVPLSVAAKVGFAGGGVDVTSMSGDFGAVTFSGGGRLSAENEFAGSRIAFEAKGEDMGEALAVFADADLPGQPFSLSLDATYHSPLVSIDRLTASVGSHTLTGNLALEGRGGQQLSRGHITLKGASARNLLAMAGLELDITEDSYTAGTDLEMSAQYLALENLQVESMQNDLSGKLRLEFGAIPRLDVDLHSREIHLPSFWPRLEEGGGASSGAAEATEENLMEVPTSSELKERLIPDSPLPLAWINSVNGHWRYQVEKSWSGEEIYSRLLADVILEGGRLKTRELGWEGTVSTGWVSLDVDARQLPYRMELELSSDRIPLLWLVAGKERPKQKSTYRGSLAAVGGTVREAASSLDGELILRAGGARLNNRGLDLVLGDVVGSITDRLNPLTKTEEYIVVECLTGAMRADKGVVSIDPGMVMRMDKIDVISHGTVNLGTEALNISFNTRSRKGVGISAGKVITPYLKVAGNLANPWLTVDPAAVAVSGTAAIATAGLSILAESLYDRWIATAKSPCKALFKKIQQVPEYQPLFALPEPGLKGPTAEALNNSR